MSRNFFTDEEKIKETALDFVISIKDLIEDLKLPPTLVFNFDQSRFEKEAHRGRTLEYQGEKKVFAVAGSKTTLTHINMIFPGISMAGELLSPIYCLISEPNGNFPAYFNDLEVPPNIKVFAGKTPNMNKNDLRTFLIECFWPSVKLILEREGQKHLLLMVDS